MPPPVPTAAGDLVASRWGMLIVGSHPFRRFGGWTPRLPPSRKHCLAAYVAITVAELDAYVLGLAAER